MLQISNIQMASSGTRQAQPMGGSVDVVTDVEISNSPKGSAIPNELV